MSFTTFVVGDRRFVLHPALGGIAFHVLRLLQQLNDTFDDALIERASNVLACELAESFVRVLMMKRNA